MMATTTMMMMMMMMIMMMMIPIDVTLVGIVIDVNDMQYWKAEAADDKS